MKFRVLQECVVVFAQPSAVCTNWNKQMWYEYHMYTPTCGKHQKSPKYVIMRQ